MIRAVWARGGRRSPVEGEHYRIDGAQAGPAPAHAVEIWLGAYKPRMLAITGREGRRLAAEHGLRGARRAARDARADRRGRGRRRPEPGRDPAPLQRQRRRRRTAGLFHGMARAARRAGALGHGHRHLYPRGRLRRRPPPLRRGGRARHARARRTPSVHARSAPAGDPLDAGRRPGGGAAHRPRDPRRRRAAQRRGRLGRIARGRAHRPRPARALHARRAGRGPAPGRRPRRACAPSSTGCATWSSRSRPGPATPAARALLLNR